MRNPNAFAAAVAGAVVTGVQYLLGAYAHTRLPLYWSDVLDTSTIALVLLVGRDGVLGALRRLWGFVKTGWAGTRPIGGPPPPG